MALVVEFLGVEHGRKTAWLAEQEISSKTMYRWRTAYLYGDLERDLVPRDTAGMDVSDGARLKQLQTQLEAERAARAAERVKHQQEVDRLHEVNEALGKAIGLLHDRDDTQEPTDDD